MSLIYLKIHTFVASSSSSALAKKKSISIFLQSITVGNFSLVLETLLKLITKSSSNDLNKETIFWDSLCILQSKSDLWDVKKDTIKRQHT